MLDRCPLTATVYGKQKRVREGKRERKTSKVRVEERNATGNRENESKDFFVASGLLLQHLLGEILSRSDKEWKEGGKALHLPFETITVGVALPGPRFESPIDCLLS